MERRGRNDIARSVKLADIADNSNLSRPPEITARDLDDAVTGDESNAAAKAQTLTLDPKGFLGS